MQHNSNIKQHTHFVSANETSALSIVSLLGLGLVQSLTEMTEMFPDLSTQSEVERLQLS